MIRHVFRLIWNRKRRHMLLMVEVLFSFLVLFYVSAIAVGFAGRYLVPLGFDYEPVWKLDLGYFGAGTDVPEEQLKATLEKIDLELKSHREIQVFSWVEGCTPYGRSTWLRDMTIEGRTIGANITIADDHFADVMGLNLLEGRWFADEDNVSGATPVVVTEQLRQQLVGDSPIIGRRHSTERRDYVVIGVIDQYRYHGEFETHPGILFERTRPFDSAGRMPDLAMIRVRPETTGRFEQKLLDNLSDIAPGWNLRIETLSDLRSAYVRDKLLGLLSMGSIAGFLVINVALGIFGVLWYSINRRRSEIALRRALGADRRRVSWQILGEAWALAAIALLAGLFLAVQVPILGLDPSIGATEYALAMLLSALDICILVFVCALYPSRLAMRIVPAQALREE